MVNRVFTSLFIFKGIALSHVVSWIEEKVLNEKELPIFMLKDIRQIYQEHLSILGLRKDIIQNVNVTRLKEDILEQMPGLCEKKDGKFVVLTVEDEVGKTLISLAQNSAKDNGFVISKAAKIIRKKMLVDDVTFDGDLSSEKQLQSVESSLLRLVSLLINGDTPIYEGTAAEKVAVNLAQLIRFNAVKANR